MRKFILLSVQLSQILFSGKNNEIMRSESDSRDWCHLGLRGGLGGCVPVTWREVHGHQVLTADTLTIEAEASDPRACATCTALKLLLLVAFR